MRTGSLFSGIGGMDLGFERAGFDIAWQCEKDPFCRAVLAKHWLGIPIYEDVKDVSGRDVPRVDCVIGGFPCQPVSVAGKRLGTDDQRWLWPHMLRVIRGLGPDWLCIENVPGLRTLGADRVLEDLEASGYSCWPLVVGADDVGAPHRRKRVWIVAYRNEQRCELKRIGGLLDGEREALGADAHGCNGEGSANRIGTGLEGRTIEHAQSERQAAERGGRSMDDSAGAGSESEPRRRDVPDSESLGRQIEGNRRESGPRTGCDCTRWPARPGEPQHDWEKPRTTQPGMGVSAHGIPRRLVNRNRRAGLKALGNAVVPQVAEVIARAILEVTKGSPPAPPLASQPRYSESPGIFRRLRDM